MRRDPARLAGVAALSSVIVLTLGACSSAPEPSVLETPQVVWPSGEPTGPYEDTEWVKAFRAQQVAEAVAWNAMDFSDKSLVESSGHTKALDLAESRVDWRLKFEATGDAQAASDEVQVGPDGSVVLDVIEDGADGAVLVTCSDSRLVESGQQVRSWTVTAQANGQFRVNYEGRNQVAGGKPVETYEAECAEITVPLGYFEPAPEPNLDLEAEVKGPVDPSKYDLD